MDFLKDIVKSLDNEFADIAESSVVGDTESFIDTGSFALNAVISGSIYGGLPSNKVTAFAGQSSTGKTFYTLAVCKHFLETNDDGGIIYFESEGALTKDVLRNHGIDLKRFVIVPVSTIQEFRTQAVKVLESYEKTDKKKRPPMLLCLDSLGMLSTSKEVEDAAEGKDTRDMTRSSLIRGAFRILSLRLSKLNIPLVITNHTYDAVGAYVPTQVQSGGKGLVYAASTIIFLSKSKDKDGTEVVGNIIKCKVEKSRFTREQSSVETKLSFKNGLDRYAGLLDLAVEAGIWKDLKGRIELQDGTKVFAKRINENPETYFTVEVLSIIDSHCAKKFKYGTGEHISTEEDADNAE